MTAVPGTAVVVDSTAGIPPAVVAGQAITVVPLQMILDGVTRLESEVTLADVSREMAMGRTVGTASPGQDRFLECYSALAERGFAQVVSLHLSSTMSASFLDAQAAAAVLTEAGGPTVHVVDTQLTAMGLGWVALTAAGAAASGMAGPGVRDLAIRTASRTLVVYTVLELDHLARTGRIGSGRATVGRLLRAKPVLRLQRGETLPAGTMRTMDKAFDRITELAYDNARGWPVHLTVQHFDAADAACQLADRVTRAGIWIRGQVDVVEVSPVIGAHVGPGAVGVVVSPTDWSDRGGD